MLGDFLTVYICKNSYIEEASFLFFIIELMAFRTRLSKHSSATSWLIVSMVKQFVS